MHLAAALDSIDSGRIAIDGVALDPLGDAARAALRRDRIGLVFQQFNLIPSLSVLQNIRFQARLAGRLDDGFVTLLATRLGLTDHLTRYPEQLSGGQQQRVAIARALAARPALILADEPTGNLDEATGDAVMDLMLELVAETGAGLMMVTHSTRLAGRLGRRLHLSHGRLDAAPMAG
jgi:putative ABC transport system ATP-binding protein